VPLRRRPAGDTSASAAGGETIVDIAKQIVRTSLSITDQDVLQVHAYRHTTELASDIAREAYKVGAEVHVTYFDDRQWTAAFVEMDAKHLSRKSKIGAGLAEIVTAEVELGGPEDPKVFDRTRPERMATMMEASKDIDDRKRERKVRGAFVALGQATPQRARKYGVSFPNWRRAINAALGYELKKLATSGQLIGKRLSGARELRLTGPDTDLTLSASGRDAFVNDGIVDENDLARGNRFTALPTGSVSIAPVETKADGHVTFPIVPLWGKMMRNLRFTFEGGRLVDFSADKNAGAFQKVFDTAKGDKDRIGSLSVGLNPRYAYVGFGDFIVQGALTVGIGANDEMGGANRGPFEFGATLPRATLRADGVSIVADGSLKV
jgi:aminopeptidase